MQIDSTLLHNQICFCVTIWIPPSLFSRVKKTTCSSTYYFSVCIYSLKHMFQHDILWLHTVKQTVELDLILFLSLADIAQEIQAESCETCLGRLRARQSQSLECTICTILVLIPHYMLNWTHNMAGIKEETKLSVCKNF